jgi:uncharacterized protein (DUF1501 family)
MNGKTLIILQLSGGNDGLNTIIPVKNDIYYKSRNQISIKEENSLLLTDEAGINPNSNSSKNCMIMENWR